jgi:hypothetical protein
LINAIVTSAALSVGCLLGFFYDRSNDNNPKVQRNLLGFAGLTACLAIGLAAKLGYVHYQDVLFAAGLGCFAISARYRCDLEMMYAYLGFGSICLAIWPAMYVDVSNGQALAGAGLAAIAGIGVRLVVSAYFSPAPAAPEHHSYNASLDY